MAGEDLLRPAERRLSLVLRGHRRLQNARATPSQEGSAKYTMASFAMSATAASTVSAVPRARVSRRQRATRAATRTRAIQEPEGETAEALPETRAADEDIPAPVGTATKEEFMRWMLNEQKLPAQKLDLVVDLPEGRGLVAREEVKRGESLLSIPESTLITVERAVAESKLGPKHAQLQEWSVLAAFLAEQALAIEAGDDSGRFATYVRALPRRTGGVLDWPEEDIKTLLAGSPSQRAAYERQASVDAAIEEIRAEFPQLTPGALRWAFDILFSRLIRLPNRGGELALVPWADMLNHKPGCEAYIDDSGGTVCLAPDRKYRPGEQVYASYGTRPSSELLISYGFAPQVGENPDDEYELVLGVDPEDRLAEEKAAALRGIGLSPVESFPLRLNGYPKQLLQYASFILCDPEDPKELPELAERALKGNAVVGGFLGALTKGKRGTQGEVLGGDAGEIAVREMLADLTSDALSKYPNSLEKDRDIAAQDPTKPPKKGKKSAFAAEVLPVQGNDGAFPNADAWVGVFSEPVRQTQRSVAAARVRASERRILAKTDSEVRLSLRKLKAAEMAKGN